MKRLNIHTDRITPKNSEELIRICPFRSISYQEGCLEIDSGCRMCGICVKNGPTGVITMEEMTSQKVDKGEWVGIAVYVEYFAGRMHNVSKELIGKARELASITHHPVYAVLIGWNTDDCVKQLLSYGVDKVFVYDNRLLEFYKTEPYASAFTDFITRVKPSSILVGATHIGRSLAPRVAARVRTGLTADCTVLQMKENSDLVQIRPAFGGNIMAQIVTPNHRPQFCTVRYKVFSEPIPYLTTQGEVIQIQLPDDMLINSVEILAINEKQKETDLSEAKVIVAVGRGIGSKRNLAMVKELADLLGAQLSCTRPLVENGWFLGKQQIGLSGRTVNADLIFTIGISGSVQFAAGMKESKCIIAINNDPNAPIFDYAHYGVPGDLREVLPELNNRIKEGANIVV